MKIIITAIKNNYNSIVYEKSVSSEQHRNSKVLSVKINS